MSKDSETLLVIAVVLLAVYFLILRKKKVVAVTNVGARQPTSVSVGGTTLTGGLANSGLVQAGALGLAAAPAIGSLFSGLFGSSAPAVAGSAPPNDTAGAFGTGDSTSDGYLDQITSPTSDYDSSGMDLLG
jgi:hypothetical protein